MNEGESVEVTTLGGKVTTVGDKKEIPRGSEEIVDTSSVRNYLEDIGLTYLETSTQFEQRAIKPDVMGSEVELTTPVSSGFVRGSKKETMHQDLSRTSGSHIEPSSSAQSFGQTTGLLPEKKSPVTGTTFEGVKDSRFDEESTTPLTKPVPIISGKKQPVAKTEKSNY